jgi:cytochrome c oxidase assembly protein subunit 15
VAAHFVHRLGALAAAALIAVFAWLVLRQGRAARDAAGRSAANRTATLILVALAAQLALGTSIVVFGVPLAVAVAHNGMAALLLLSLINAHQRIWQR